jgi:AGCS family alanine or glycine:cation symporter
METLQIIRDWLWGVPLIALLVGTGVYLTIRLRGLQFRYLGYALKLAFTRHDDTAQGDISHFQALMTSLAAIIGIGSLAGVATALVTGGLGALFWMIIAALIGMATKYAEAILAIKYREVDELGEMSGGPMYYIERGMKWKKIAKVLAVIFSIAGALTALTTGNMVQSSSITDVLHEILNVDRWGVGVVIAILTGLVLFGGIKNIGRVASVLVPVMSIFYIVGGLIILVMRYDQLPAAIELIVTSAFSGQAAIGGLAGSTIWMAIQMGVSRGVFASESGLGSSPIAAAAAKSDVPGRQAMISMTGAFLAVCVVCTITGLVLAVTGVLGAVDSQGHLLNGLPLTVRAFAEAIPWGEFIVIISAILFAYSTILGWAYYGEKCAEYLLGERAIFSYRALFTLIVIAGAVLHIDIVWNLADITNALMALPNLIALIVLAGVVSRETKSFLKLVHRETDGIRS